MYSLDTSDYFRFNERDQLEGDLFSSSVCEIINLVETFSVHKALHNYKTTMSLTNPCSPYSDKLIVDVLDEVIHFLGRRKMNDRLRFQVTNAETLLVGSL